MTPTTHSQTEPEPFNRPVSNCISADQAAWLKRELMRRRQIRICRCMLLILFLSLWELSALNGWIDSFIFSSPSLIGRCLLSMAADRSLFLHTGITLGETLVSFLICTLGGLGCALLLWLSPTAAQILEPVFVLLNSLPKSALAPLLIVWLGNRPRTIITAAVSVAIFGSVLTLYTGFSRIDPDLIRLIRSLGGTRLHILKLVVLPGSLPLLISNMKVNIGLCLVGVIIGEFLSSKAGLGYLITYGSQTFAMTRVITSIVILCVLSVLLYQIISWCEKRVSQYSR